MDDQIWNLLVTRHRDKFCLFGHYLTNSNSCDSILYTQIDYIIYQSVARLRDRLSSCCVADRVGMRDGALRGAGRRRAGRAAAPRLLPHLLQQKRELRVMIIREPFLNVDVCLEKRCEINNLTRNESLQ